jgi:hypothetical protein
MLSLLPRFSFTKSWTTTEAGVITRLADVLSTRLDLEHEGTPGETETILRGGSQLRTRLLGGWFISPAHLPKRVQLLATSEPGGTRRVHVRVDDTLGAIAVRDRWFGRRYEQAADSVFAVVERTLSGTSQ